MVKHCLTWVLRLGVCLLLPLSVGCGAKAIGKAHIERGDLMLAQSKVGKAVDEYELALKTPARTEALLRLVGLYETAGEFAKAEKYLQQASADLPMDPDLRLSHARILAAKGRVHEAFDEARRLLQSAPRNEAALALCAAFATARDEATDAADKLTSFHTLELRRGHWGRAAAETFIPLAHLYDLLAEPDAARRARARAKAIGVRNLALAINVANAYFSMDRLLPAEELFQLAATRQPARAATWLRLAAVRVGLSEFEQADQAMAHLGKQARSTPEAQVIEARVQLGLGAAARAEQILERLLSTPHENQTRHSLSRAHFWLGHTRLAQRDPRGAEHEFKEALQIDPKYDTAALALADLYLSENRPDAAIARLEQLAKAKPGNGQVQRLLGRARLDNQDPKGAAKAFERYTQLEPHDAEGPYLAATALSAQGHVEQARKYLETSLALEPTRFETLQALVRLMVRQGHFEEAENRLQIELARRGRSAALLTLFAGVLFEQRTEADAAQALAEAERVYREAIHTDGSYTPAWLGLGQLYAATGRTGAALLLYQAGLSSVSQPEALWLQIGQLHARNGDGPEAKTAYEQVLATQPNSIPALNNLAYVYSELLKLPEAGLRFAQRARALAPNAPNVADTYGWLLWQHGRSETALPLLQEAANQLPNSAEAQYHLGLALVRTGQRQAGRAALARALELSQTFPGAKQARLALRDRARTLRDTR